MTDADRVRRIRELMYGWKQAALKEQFGAISSTLSNCVADLQEIVGPPLRKESDTKVQPAKDSITKRGSHEAKGSRKTHRGKS